MFSFFFEGFESWFCFNILDLGGSLTGEDEIIYTTGVLKVFVHWG